MMTIKSAAKTYKLSRKTNIAKQKPLKPCLKMTGKMYFCLLFFQLLNLSTLVFQFHLLYLLFAIFVLTLQLIVHVKIARKSSHTARYSQLLESYTLPKVLPSWLVLLLAISGSVGIAIAGQELGLLLSMIHLLCFAYSLKMFEIPSRKDLYQLVVLGIFVAVSSLIFVQSIYFSLAVIVLVLGNFMILLNLFAPTMALSAQTKLLAKLSVYSIPFAIILFIGFPKLSPFWQVPSVKSAKVGLSDSVKIGDIAKLALSNELAFRVSFQNKAPAHAQLYWRAMVLDDFDGTTWRQGKLSSMPSHLQVTAQDSVSNSLNNLNNPNNLNFTAAESRKRPAMVELRGSAVDYQIITEPSFQSWLFALDFANSDQGDVGQRNDFSLFYRGIVNQTLSYQVTSYPEAVLSAELTDDVRASSLALTSANNPKLLVKGQQLRRLYRDDKQLINHVLADFNQNDYFYTLQPPTLTANSLDQFYFDTRAGFCEHYASSFTYLMRAAGIPARMVVGYLGGEFNPKGNYLSVYQRNAHAWSEVWLPNKGWQRIDPTAAVDLERVESGFSSNLMQQQADLSSDFFSAQALKSMWWYRQLSMQIDAIDYQWTRWVIGYNAQQQSRVMADFLASLTQAKNLFYLLSTILSLTLLLFFLKRVKASVKTNDKIKDIYLKTLALMAQHKLIKARSMTAKQFAELVTTTRPELAENFTIISACFEQLAYQHFDDELENSVLNGDCKKAIALKQKLQAAQKLAQGKQIKMLQRSYRQLRWTLWLIKLGIKSK
ncbi:DUF3488 domain-containing protein [Colwellia sp. Arc7-635]|uniref:transglutaminase TgpA family protein n=1 Tax=Colwellia sp. Arc7-635 TaxID=2497879 RepID=UPI000F84FE13|nr:DUF3488 and transglutaminase-like domain-containing protein [Colwellia sp. Arc7-635]AZQ83826.1 DUF3488 domain-containing protein [Colwellia sp. Arc7-635]